MLQSGSCHLYGCISVWRELSLLSFLLLRHSPCIPLCLMICHSAPNPNLQWEKERKGWYSHVLRIQNVRRQLHSPMDYILERSNWIEMAYEIKDTIMLSSDINSDSRFVHRYKWEKRSSVLDFWEPECFSHYGLLHDTLLCIQWDKFESFHVVSVQGGMRTSLCYNIEVHVTDTVTYFSYLPVLSMVASNS